MRVRVLHHNLWASGNRIPLVTPVPDSSTKAYGAIKDLLPHLELDRLRFQDWFDATPVEDWPDDQEAFWRQYCQVAWEGQPPTGPEDSAPSRWLAPFFSLCPLFEDLLAFDRGERPELDDHVRHCHLCCRTLAAVVDNSPLDGP